MNHVRIEILGKNYQLACDAGQEKHLQQLAEEVSERLKEFEKRFIESGTTPQESMLWLMTTVTLMDEIYDLRRESAYWQREAINAAALPTEDPRKKEMEAALTERIDKISEHLERLL